MVLMRALVDRGVATQTEYADEAAHHGSSRDPKGQNHHGSSSIGWLQSRQLKVMPQFNGSHGIAPLLRQRSRRCDVTHRL